eukprot:1251326-Heterocapsa_arctica.AAC.1
MGAIIGTFFQDDLAGFTTTLYHTNKSSSRVLTSSNPAAKTMEFAAEIATVLFCETAQDQPPGNW